MKQERPYIGIDVAKAHLDLATHLSGEPWRVANDEAGISAIVTHLRELAPTLVVMEATGGLELPLAGELLSAQLPVAVVNPRQVRDFAKALGRPHIVCHPRGHSGRRNSRQALVLTIYGIINYGSFRRDDYAWKISSLAQLARLQTRDDRILMWSFRFHT